MKILLPQDSLENEPVSVALGAFDGVHLGHAAVIRAAAQRGLKTAVATFWQHPSLVLHNRRVRLLTNRELKEQALAGLGVDETVYLDFEKISGLSPEAFVKDILYGHLHARAVFCGFNYRFGRNATAGAGDLAALCTPFGIETACVEPVAVDGRPVSSTRIRGLVERGDMENTARLLGRPFAYSLPVVHGRMLARQWGMPTINQPIDEELILPVFGVYASAAHVGGRRYPAVTNIGVKPTFGDTSASAETYIVGYSGDLYGRRVKVELFEFLRPEIKFDDIDALRMQMEQDTQKALELLRPRFSSGIYDCGCSANIIQGVSETP